MKRVMTAVAMFGGVLAAGGAGAWPWDSAAGDYRDAGGGAAAEGPRRVTHVVLSLPDQGFAAYSGDRVVLRGPVSTGKAGYTTPSGSYRVSNKHRHWVSTIYGIPMPYFLRLNGGSIGLHAGYLPGFPASHGCIRLLEGDAARLFAMAPVGTRVQIVGYSTGDTAGIPQPKPKVRYYRVVRGKKVFMSEKDSDAYSARLEKSKKQGTKSR